MDYASIPANKKAPALRLLLTSIPPEMQREIRIAHNILPDQWWRFPSFRFATLAWKNLLASRGFDAGYFQINLSEVCVPLIEEALSLR